MTKIYGVYGVDEAIYHIKRGKAFVKCEFTNGKVDGTDQHPAKLQTSNPIAQILIENSEMFNTKIFLLETIGQPTPVNANAPKEHDQNPTESEEEDRSNNSEEKTEYNEVTTTGDAMNVLKSLGVKASMLRSKEMVLQAAEEIGVAFPNLK